MANSVGIIGFGRFGQSLAQLLSDQFIIKAYDPKQNQQDHPYLTDLQTVLAEKDIFIAVPIRAFETLISDISTKLILGTTIIDTCSVKIYPVKIMQTLLAKDIGIIATHPMFGPDSLHFNNKKIMMYNSRDVANRYLFWKHFFTTLNIDIVEITPEEHDQLAANSQGITHLIGRMLEKMNLKPTKIDTQGFEYLMKITGQTCSDTWELFLDLQTYNPYSKAVIEDAQSALEALKKELGKDVL